MSQETASGITTAGDGPIQGETPTREFSPTELGISGEEIPTSETPPQDQQQSPDPEDAIGLALKRGRPARDLDGLDDDEQKLFKNMSREAYERLFPFYKKFKGKDKDLDELPTLREKLKSLESAPPKASSFYDHEEAYLLQQDYRDALVKSRELRDLQSHWQEQLIAAEEGKPVRDILTGPNGELQLSDPIEANPRIKAQILATLSQVTQAQQAHQASLEGLKAQAKSQFTNYRDGLSKVYDNIFAKHKDTLEPLAAKEIEQFPPFARDRIETKLMANALALIKYIVNADKQQKSQAQVTTANTNGSKVAGPTMRSITTSPKPAPSAATTADDFKRFKMEFGV